MVFHLAAYAAESLSHYIRHYNYRNNVLGSIALINQAIRTKADCFVYTSSIAVYGTNRLPMTEDLVPKPEDPYGIAKYTIELDLAAAQKQFGLDHIIFRPHNVYGERQNVADRYRNVVGIFMNQLLAGEPMTVFGDGRQTRAFSHVSDVAPVIARSPMVRGARNEVFNVGADDPVTVLDLGRAVADALGVEARFEHVPPRYEVMHAHAAHDKLRGVFGTERTTSLEEGLRRMAEWIRGEDVRPPLRPYRADVVGDLPTAWANLRAGSE